MTFKNAKMKCIVFSVVFVLFFSKCVYSFETPKYITSQLEKSCQSACQNNVSIVKERLCKCEKKDWTLILKNVPKLLCISDDSLVLKFEDFSANKDLEYFVEKSANTGNWSLVTKVNSSIIKINDLHHNSTNKFRAWSITNEGVVNLYQETQWLQTFTKDFIPGPVSNLKLDKYYNDENNFEAVLSWEPSNDLPCNYQVTWFGPDSYTEIELENPEILNSTVISNLRFDSEYSASVVTKDSKWFLESKKEWLNFTTPSCLEVFENNITVCAPPEPTGLNVEVYINRKNVSKCDVVITWDTPMITPDSYEVILLVFSPQESRVFANISGESNTTTFEDLDIDVEFEVYLVAISQGGKSVPLHFHQSYILRQKYSEDVFNVKIIIAITTSVAVSLFLLILLFFYKRNKEIADVKNYFMDVDIKNNLFPLDNDKYITKVADEWEIGAKSLRIDCFLGKGAFGVVRKGFLSKDFEEIEVAVKMLRDDVTSEEIVQFKQEMDILKSVGSHPHVVSLIGCCTCVKFPRDLRLIVEYCAKGDLQTYLRNISDNLRDCSSDELENGNENAYLNGGINFSNKAYLMQAEQNPDRLQVKDLLSIARQIALGMEYLSNMKVVHRDLAARNVLICEDNTVKVSDFGLSRDVYKYNVYYKTGGGKLPIKWMAIESLTHQRYTTESDVWSYGILLWEIFTLGGTPYPEIEDMADFLFKLKNGYRMDCPANCSNEVYSLMQCCWKSNPKQRPTFTTIAKVFGTLLECSSGYINLDLAATGINAIEEIRIKAKSPIFGSNRYVNPF